MSKPVRNGLIVIGCIVVLCLVSNALHGRQLSAEDVQEIMEYNSTAAQELWDRENR